MSHGCMQGQMCFHFRCQGIQQASLIVGAGMVLVGWGAQVLTPHNTDWHASNCNHCTL